MVDQIDLDKGGAARTYQKVWMGPSVGWQFFPTDSAFVVSLGGTYSVERTVTKIWITALAGSITINLPSTKAAPVGPMVLPGQWIATPLFIGDSAGACGGAVDCSLVAAPGELIGNVQSIKLSSPFGSLILNPLLDIGGWIPE